VLELRLRGLPCPLFDVVVVVIHPIGLSLRAVVCSASLLNLIVRRSRLLTYYGDRAFPVVGPRLRNSLSPQVTSASSVKSFNTRLETFLLSPSFR